MRRIDVGGVEQRVDDQHEDGARDEFREEHACPGHEWLRVSAKDAGGRGFESDGADSLALKLVDGGDVIGIHNGRSSHGAENLSSHVDGELAPGEPSVEAVGERDGRIDVSPRLARHINTQHDTDTRGELVRAV